MEKKIKISIVIAAYNGERYIAEQVKSLLEQTFLPDEIIICDDSKNDLTFQAVQAFMPNSIIRYIKNDEPLGVAGNFEKALSLARGEYIFMCDQDDVWLPDKVRVMTAMLEENCDVDGVFCNSTLVDENLEHLGQTLWQLRKFTCSMQKTLASGDALKVFCRRVVCSGHNIAIKRRALEYILPFPQLTPFYPDTWIALSTALNSKWLMCNGCLTLYRLHTANNSDPAGRVWQAAKKARTDSAARRNYLLACNLLVRGKSFEPEKRKMLEEFALHHCSRSLYDKNIVIRTAQAVRELCGLRYKKYANGLRTFIADIIFKP